MRLFAVADLHLPGGQEKPMDVFGQHWEGHFERICEDWRSRVTAEDTVLIAGDISWAMTPAEALEDLRAIGALPGRKVLLKGNHDYWWPSLARLQAMLPDGMRAVQNNALDLGACVVCGSRGWTLPTEAAPLDPGDERLYRRELIRLELSLQAGQKLANERPLVAMTHFPPLYLSLRDTEVTALMERYGVRCVVYGHLHGAGIATGFTGSHRGIDYYLTSCDSLGFRLKEIRIPRL